MKLLLTTASLIAFNTGAALAAGHGEAMVTSEHSFVLETVAEGLEHPWGLDFLSGDRLIVTERPGNLRIVEADGTVGAPLQGMPEIISEFRDGLLDVTVSQTFEADNTIFFAYSDIEDGMRWLKVASAIVDGPAIANVTTIFETSVRTDKDQGFGARIRYDATGHLLITVGDHMLVNQAQDPSDALGTIIRISTDGTPAAGNPGGEMHPAIYAMGFKNSQGITVANDGTIWATDHGGVGGGELNLIAAGANYGWPVRTFGGSDAPGAEAAADFVDPVFTWGIAPTVALSGLELYEGDAFPNWKGDFFTGSLVQQSLIRVMMDEAGHVIGTEYVLDGTIGRVRDVREAPDGSLYVLNDDPAGAIFRITPQ